MTKYMRISLLSLSSLFAITYAAAVTAEPITIDGSSTVYPISKAVADEYMEKHPEVSIHVDFSGTTGGMRKFVTGEIDIADASRPITTEEIAEAKKNGVEFIELPIAFDALTVVVHPENSWAKDIGVSDLIKIWSKEFEGKETKWSDIRPDWPDKPIALHGPGADSGTYDFFIEAVLGEDGVKRSDYHASEDDNELVEGVAADPNALGYFGYAYFVENEDRLRALSVSWDVDPKTGEKRKWPAIAPSGAAVLRGHYVPLGRPLFLYVNKARLLANPTLRSFLEHYLADDRNEIRETGYLPLSEVAYLQALERLAENETGTSFQGKPALGVSVHEIYTKKPTP